MKSIFSKQPQTEPRKSYFCSEPWAGIFSIETNLDVTFCPCYLRLKIGNLNEASLQEIWNAEALVQLRRSFQQGELPAACQNQLCPVVLGEQG
jgi:MoaA/NifB/PqqE/SkfB family radical SAM enzyme